MNRERKKKNHHFHPKPTCLCSWCVSAATELTPVLAWVQRCASALASLGTGLSAASTLRHLKSVKTAQGSAVHPRAHVITHSGRAPTSGKGRGQVLPTVPELSTETHRCIAPADSGEMQRTVQPVFKGRPRTGDVRDPGRGAGASYSHTPGQRRPGSTSALRLRAV